MIMATNRPDVLDPALMRPGRLDRKIEIPLPNEQARMEILKIHASGVAKHGEIDYEAIVKLAENFNGADLRNICTEAGMFAIRDERDYTVQVLLSVACSSDQLGIRVVKEGQVTLIQPRKANHSRDYAKTHNSRPPS